MDTQHEMIICLGSSCFSRGNSKNLRIIQDYLKKNNLETKVDFKGNLCSEHCNLGPILQIGDRIYKHVDESNIISILNDEFGGNL
ncbi:MAG: (2Fe-2S) ferredoxin domain-containing protein [Bacteroidota bacterium]|nr:(2Fe-2S) ferredoxin domain-containing protein [Bacteroidota bacterium]